MALSFVFMMCPVGIGVALLRRLARAVPAGPGVRDDMPARLLCWAAGLLPAGRAEWGQAMLGELDHIEGRARRWRFAVGCAGAVLLPWGRAAAAAWAVAAIAVGAADLYASVAVRYRLGAGDWVWAAIMVVFLACFTLAASVLVRHPAVALPGLLGGLSVAPPPPMFLAACKRPPGSAAAAAAGARTGPRSARPRRRSGSLGSRSVPRPARPGRSR
jgi:hypothetical protein